MVADGRVAPKRSPCARPYLLGPSDVGHEHAGPDHIVQTPAYLIEGPFDDPQRLEGLPVRVSLPQDASVGSEGRGSRDEHLPPDADRSRVAEPRLPRGTARDALPTHLNPRPYGRERGSRDRPLTYGGGCGGRDAALPHASR